MISLLVVGLAVFAVYLIFAQRVYADGLGAFTINAAVLWRSMH